MLKKSLGRGICGFAFGVTTGQIFQILIVAFSGRSDVIPLVPAYQTYFSSKVIALGVSNLLIGIISMAFGMSSVIFDIERWSFFKQGVVHFCITTIVWFPIAVFLWGMIRYPQAIWRTLIGFFITYVVTWAIQYRMCRKDIDDINRTIQKRKE